MIEISETVLYSSIFTASWNNIYSILKTINDPEARDNVKWIFSAYPDKLFDDKDAYPIMVIHPFDMSGYDVWTMGTTPEKQTTLPVQIDIFTLKALQIDEIMDDVFKKFEDSEGTFHTYKMKNMGVLRSSYSNFERGGMKVHFKSISYGFKFNFSV